MINTGLSGNEIFCLDAIGLKAGDLLVGNSVHSLGFLGGLGSGFKAVMGGEIRQVTELIWEGRKSSLDRMLKEAEECGGVGISGVTSELVNHGGIIEFLTIGSAVLQKQSDGAKQLQFTSSADGQELYCQVDAGYRPVDFVFGNVAYSIGIAKGLIGGLKTLKRGEVKEFSGIFNTTRNLALQRVVNHARKVGANSVVGIETTILPIGISGIQEMIMIGTASHNKHLPPGEIVTCDLTCQELWNITRMGYAPLRLLLGTSVYSLGFVGGVSSFFKSFVKGEIEELTHMIYGAREESLAIIRKEAEEIGADDVVGIKTYVYQLGNGLIEFLAIGTAVKKIPGLKTASEQILPQAIIADQDTFANTAEYSFGVDLNKSKR